MRILTWNINGIRTLPQYHPWNTHKTGDAILAALDADIICFQEMKIQRAALEAHIAVPERFDSYFSFPAAKGGYSGVAVYTRTAAVAPLKAEEGLTGTLQPAPPFSADERISTAYPQAADLALEPELFADADADAAADAAAPPPLAALDAEGRALALDFGLFVLINVYCPAETTPARLPYKMRFLRALEARVRRLTAAEGREVVVVGDLNVAAAPLDAADGALPSARADFWAHPPRAWLRRWLAPAGPMVDAVRATWPEREGMYTCWNTKLGARAANYGARLDYVLLSRGLLPWLKRGDTQPALRGSDHCPVVVELHDARAAAPGRVLALRDAMCYAAARGAALPRISARRWREHAGAQPRLDAFFARRGAAGAGSRAGGAAREAAGDASSSQEPAGDASSSQGPAGDASSSQEPAGDVSSQGAAGNVPSQETPEDAPSQDAPAAAGDVPPSQADTPSPSPASSSAPPAPAARKKKRDDGAEQPQRKKRKTGQTKLSAFFSRPGAGASRASAGGARADERSQVAADYDLARALSGADAGAPRAAPSSQAKAAWTHLLAPLQPPHCRVHREPCKEFTVNKTGPNKGKTFFVCARPVGPGYDKGPAERLREEVDPQYRCNYFKWASEVKREALKGAGAALANGASSSSGAVSEPDSADPGAR